MFRILKCGCNGQQHRAFVITIPLGSLSQYSQEEEMPLVSIIKPVRVFAFQAKTGMHKLRFQTWLEDGQE